MRKKNKYIQVGNGFQTWKPWTPTSNKIYAPNPKESKNKDPNAIFYEPLVFAIPTHEKDMKWGKKKYVQVGNGFQMWKPWTPTLKTIYATNSREFKI